MLGWVVRWGRRKGTETMATKKTAAEKTEPGKAPETVKIPALDEVVSYMGGLADALDQCERRGADVDSPEGTRFIVLSDTHATLVAGRLRELVGITETAIRDLTGQ